MSKLTPRSEPYKMATDGIYWWDGLGYGERLANFTASIVKDTLVDDGKRTRIYTLKVTLDGQTSTVTTTSKKFPSCEWAEDAFGAKAIVALGRSVKVRVCYAVRDSSYPQEITRKAA